MKRSLSAVLVGIALAIGCGDTESDDAPLAGGEGSGGTPEGSGGTPEGSGGTPEGSGGTPEGSGGNGGMGGDVATLAGAGGVASCLEDDGPASTSFGGGACEGSTRCSDSESLSYRTCAWLWGSGRASAFDAMRGCMSDADDLCESQEAVVGACLDEVTAQTCDGGAVVVDGTAVDCTDLAGGCPAMDAQECSQLMNLLDQSHRQQAFECYLAEENPADCVATLHDCIGVQE